MRSPSLIELPPPPDMVTVWPWTRGSQPLPEAAPDGRPWPRLSIVILSMNQHRFLEHALRSVLLQAYPRLEIIVMDGGSTDGSVATLQKYDPWLQHWASRPDGGPADALNSGFGLASGEILGFLNADDFYLPDSLGKVAGQFTVAPGTEVVSGNGYFATESGDLGVRAFSDVWNLTRFRYGACVLLQPATFFRRAAFERTSGFRQSGRVCWDMELWADLAGSGASFGSINANLAAFRLHDESLTASTTHQRRRREDARAVMAEMRGRPESPVDRLAHALFRLAKFSRHPCRSLSQRTFFHTTLKRWSL